ncbi:hypothetical protein HYPSUDRAFT_143120 [Hypholoma sublateritium FD-334 SS-4]|uniref:BTB domain-containing protein n=1 Tax=Hypholoma sublateritium (strain FD-334 SS-4) TaxID=945553 RepID=A0A0D2PIY0_HYPSF|nr:hypothetical protein HYPSUDRAFT_143120 [Hypholoma sublateritium FD-334 SS-4]
MTTNPSHILIARNSRGLNNPAASLSSPTETHAAASGIFRSSGSPPWLLEDFETDEIDSELSGTEEEEAIDIEETFTKNCKLPGTVKIVVESTTFWAHKEILFFASPFFEAVLGGEWSETGRPQSISSIVTVSQLRTANESEHSTDDSKTGDSADVDSGELEIVVEQDVGESENDECADDIPAIVKAKEREDCLAQLQGQVSPKANNLPRTRKFPNSSTASFGKSANAIRTNRQGTDAVIMLKEERASTFHDFLKFIYPQMECTITWNNVASLMNLSHKLSVPSLQSECLTFLLTHAAGKPIKAMRIAELFQEEELYRESSRFVLDNPGGWTELELNTLSQETLLKLEKRRNWFLERVLKLGLTMIAKEYQCCSSCPDSAVCARLLEEKWRQAYHAVFRFGPPQPSMVFRYLRMLEGVSPALALTQTACQASAKAFVATCAFLSIEIELFDRMFSLGVRGGGGIDAPPLPGRAAVAAAAATVNGPRRHFLYCTLKPDLTHKSKGRKSRDQS